MTTPPSDREEFHRRASDVRTQSHDEEILTLIRSATQEHEKAQLMVLYQLNRSQIESNRLVCDVAERLQKNEELVQKHMIDYASRVKREEEWYNQGAGASKALKWTITIVGGIITAMGGYILADVKELIRSNANQDIRIQAIEQAPPISQESARRLAVLEAQLTNAVAEMIDLRHRMDDHERADARDVREIKRKVK